MSLLSAEQQTFIAQCRAKYQAKEPVSIEEMKRCVMILRGSRTAAVDAYDATKPATKRKSAPSDEAVASALSALDDI